MARPIEFDKQRALVNAMQLFWRQGYTATSLPQLLQTMGIGRSSFYAAFGDKRSLFIESLELFGDRTANILVDISEREDPINAVRCFFESTLFDAPADRMRCGCMMVDEVREFYGASEGNVVSQNLFNFDQTIGMVLNPYALVEINTETEEPVRNRHGFLTRVNKHQPGLLLGKITKANPFVGYTDSNKSASKVLQNVFVKGDQWFNTGDLVKNIGFNHLQFMDRTGDTYRWKGENVSTGQVEMIVNQYEAIEEAISYGVEIPKTNGRAGMISVTLKDKSLALDGKGLFTFLKEEMPSYAVPVFLRIKENFDSTGTFKYQKASLKNEAFNVNTTDELIQVALPGSNLYQPLTVEIMKKINNCEYRF